MMALLPVAILLYYIYKKDKLFPEPPQQLIKAFLLGILSCFISLAMSLPFGMIGLYKDAPDTIIDSVFSAFWGAAIPEECAKLFILWLVLRHNKYFDETMDGIVYSVCVSLGFAAFENVLYLFSNSDSFISVGIGRAIFSIPGHFCFGVLMGYYYSLSKFYTKSPLKNRILVLAAPVIVHGIYDSLLFSMNTSPAYSVLLMILFIILCHKLWVYCSRKIKEHLERDRERSNISSDI